MDVVRGGWGGEEQQVGVPGVEVAVRVLRKRLQVQVLDAPHLQARLLSCSLKLLMGNHVGSADKETQKKKKKMEEEGNNTEGET